MKKNKFWKNVYRLRRKKREEKKIGDEGSL